VPISSIYLGWDTPCLPAATTWLAQRFRSDDHLDLRRARVVLPGARAGRRLLELLVGYAEEEGLRLTPPRILTAGVLPDELYPKGARLAAPIEREVAWGLALRAIPADVRATLLPAPPDEHDLSSWLALGGQIDDLYREIAAGGLLFTDVSRICRERLYEGEERWEVLAAVESEFQQTLTGAGRVDREALRRTAVAEGLMDDGPIVIVGSPDLNLLTRRMLAAYPGEVTVLIHAPEALAHGFDETGVLKTSFWRARPIDLPAGIIEVVPGPADQADAVVAALAKLTALPAEEITIGVLDQEVKPHLLERLTARDLPARDAAGRQGGTTAPAELLQLIARYTASHAWSDLAALVRHGAVQEWLIRAGVVTTFLSSLDGWQVNRLPARTDGPLPGKGDEVVNRIVGLVRELLAPLTGPARPLHEWAQPIADLIITIFGHHPLNRFAPADALMLATIEELQRSLQALASLAGPLTPPGGAAHAIRAVLRPLEGAHLEVPDGDEAIELLGWLELHLDDAPALILTGVNEGFVPESINSHHLLPDSLRRELGLLDNERRYARDAYIFSALLASHRHLTIVAGRRTGEGEALKPSRLLLAASGEELAARVLRLFREFGETAATPAGATTSTGFEIPRPVVNTPVESMSATSFRSYLACPYRFYLRHLLRLGAESDSAAEIEAPLFGSITHVVLRGLYDSPAGRSSSVREVREFLLDTLHTVARHQFGSTPLPTVPIQLRALEARLASFAEWQAARARDGWEIAQAEYDFSKLNVLIELADESSMKLVGQVDRIDFHPATGSWAIFDYKVGDTARDPDETHRRRGSWVDLQLPAYLYALRQTGFLTEASLGYLCLSADPAKPIEQLAPWTEVELASAFAEMQSIATRVRAGCFWPPAAELQHFDEFADICGTGQFARVETTEGEVA